MCKRGVYACEFTCPLTPEDGVESSGAVVTGSWELLDLGVGTKLWSSARSEWTLNNWAISPCPLPSKECQLFFRNHLHSHIKITAGRWKHDLKTFTTVKVIKRVLSVICRINLPQNGLNLWRKHGSNGGDICVCTRARACAHAYTHTHTYTHWAGYSVWLCQCGRNNVTGISGRQLYVCMGKLMFWVLEEEISIFYLHP